MKETGGKEKMGLFELLKEKCVLIKEYLFANTQLQTLHI